jgi:hypothetical protein
MSLASTIARARAFQAKQFTSTGSITRETAPGSINPTTGVYTPPTTSNVYTGVCSVRPAGNVGSDVQAGEVEVRSGDFVVRLPVNTVVKKDDVVAVTASTYDSGLVGRKFRITDVPADDLQIARVAMLEEIT